MNQDLDKLSDDDLNNLLMSKFDQSKPVNYDEMSDEDIDMLVASKMLKGPKKEKEPEKESTQGQALLEGFGQGLTAGYLPQLQAKLEPLTDRVFNMFDENGDNVDLAPMSQLTSNGEDYLKARDANVKRNRKLESENPWSYNTAQITGAVGVGAAATPVRALSAVSKAKQAAGLGGAYGLLTNPGDVENVLDSIQVGPRLRNALFGTITGWGAQKGIEKIAKYSKPLADKVLNAAERKAAKSLGLQKHLRKDLTQKQIDDAGRFALDNDVISLKPLKNTEDMIRRNQTALNKAGGSMDDVLTKLDDAGASEFNPLEAAVKVDDELGKIWRTPINKSAVKQFDNTIETIFTRGDKNIPIKEAQELKKLLGTASNWKNSLNVSDKERIARDAYKIVNEYLDESIEKGAKTINADELLSVFQKAKKDYGAGKTVEKLLQNKTNMEQGNRAISLTDFIVGTGGATTLGPWGIGLVGAKKMVEKYGNQATAKFLNNTGKVISKIPGVNHLANQNPTAFQAVVHKLAVQNEGRLGPRALNVAEEEKDIKGRDKWITRGLANISQAKSDINLEDPDVIKKLLETKIGEDLLIEASDLTLESRRMNNLLMRMKKYINEVNE